MTEPATEQQAKDQQIADDHERMDLRKTLRAIGATSDEETRALHDLNIRLLEKWK